MENVDTRGASPRRDPSPDVYDCNHPEGLSLLTRRDLPRTTRDAVRRLQTIDPRHNVKILVFAGIWALAGWGAVSSPTWLVTIPLILVMGFCLTGLPVFMHEACHHLLFRNVFLNRWVGFLCGLPGLVSVTAYRTVHLIHHSATRTENDPDDIERSAPSSIPLRVVYAATLLTGIYLYIVAVAVVAYRKASPQGRRDILVEYILILSSAGALLATVSFEMLFIVWLLPLLIAGQLSNVRGLAEHGLTSTGNPFIDTRTVISNRFVSFWMNNLNYHIEHHLFPGIPWYNLPALHVLLQTEYRQTGASVYRSYSSFLWDFIKRATRGIAPHKRMIPSHIAEDLCA